MPDALPRPSRSSRRRTSPSRRRSRVQSLLALARYNSGRYAEAGVLYEKVHARDAPITPSPNYYLGLIALNEGRLADALGLLDKFVAMKATANPANVKNAEDVIAVLKKGGATGKK